jgi:hypothetical protein
MVESAQDIDGEYRTRASAALEADDWHGAYRWAKGWIGGGGAGLVDPWLVYVASSLLQGQPRGATHSMDMALASWFDSAPDRAVLHLVRSRIVWRWLRDSKAALLDLELAKAGAPLWLAEEIDSDEASMRADAATSRKRKPAVSPAPGYRAVGDHMTNLAFRRQAPGMRPQLWGLAHHYIDRPT